VPPTCLLFFGFPTSLVLSSWCVPGPSDRSPLPSHPVLLAATNRSAGLASGELSHRRTAAARPDAGRFRPPPAACSRRPITASRNPNRRQHASVDPHAADFLRRGRNRAGWSAISSGAYEFFGAFGPASQLSVRRGVAGLDSPITAKQSRTRSSAGDRFLSEAINTHLGRRAHRESNWPRPLGRRRGPPLTPARTSAPAKSRQGEAGPGSAGGALLIANPRRDRVPISGTLPLPVSALLALWLVLRLQVNCARPGDRSRIGAECWRGCGLKNGRNAARNRPRRGAKHADPAGWCARQLIRPPDDEGTTYGMFF